MLKPQLLYLHLTPILFTIYRKNIYLPVYQFSQQFFQKYFSFVTDTNLHKPLIWIPKLCALKTNKTIVIAFK